MFNSKLRRPLPGLAVTAGLLAVAGPASAEVAKPGHPAGAIVYNGHAGLGTNWAAPELDANANAVFSGDAYNNEMGIVPPVRRASGEVMRRPDWREPGGATEGDQLEALETG